MPIHTRCTAALRVTCLVLGASLIGCGGDDDSSSDNGDDPPPSTPRDVPVGEEEWSNEVIADENAGQFLRLRYDEGEDRPVLAYYAMTGIDDGPCVEIGDGIDVPTRRLWNLVYGEEQMGGWQFETVVQTLSQSDPRGFDLQLAADGTPTIAAITGVPITLPMYCGAHDLGLFTRDAPDSWSEQTLVVTSGEAASGEPASDAGEIVGYWPALAFDGGGNPAVAYRDVHFGGIQNDDFERADLEISIGGSARPVDVGVGAGQFNQLHFDPEGRPLIVHYNPVMQELDNRTGLWVARSEDGGSTWEHVRLFSAPLINPPSSIFDADGQLQVAYYDPGRGVPVLATLLDDAMFTSFNDGWQEETIGDPRFDEGYDPSLAMDADGRLGLAYYRCARTDMTRLGSCDAQEDGLILAHRAAGADDFEIEEVDGGEDIGECGRSASLIFEGSGRPAVAYACNGRDGDTLIEQVRLARREAL